MQPNILEHHQASVPWLLAGPISRTNAKGSAGRFTGVSIHNREGSGRLLFDLIDGNVRILCGGAADSLNQLVGT